MIVNKYNKGGGGSGSGVTPQDVQRQIDSALTPYWESGETKDYVDEAISGISLDGYYTSAQTEDAISAATAGKADAQNIQPSTGTGQGNKPWRFADWNKQGVITGPSNSSSVYGAGFAINNRLMYTFTQQRGDFPHIYAPLSAGTAGEVLVSLGDGSAPIWSAMTFPTPDVDKAYVDSAITEVQDQIDTMDEVVSSALVDLKDKIDEISGATPSVDLSGYYTSAQTEDAISVKVESAYTILDAHITEVEQVTASAYTELHNDILEVSARTAPDMSLYTPTSGFSTINGSAITNGGNIVIQGGEGGNSNILAAITTQAEYEAISGDVKTGDLIQVQDVVLDGYDGPQYGLFEADVQEEESDGVVRKSIYWERRDNSHSVLLSDEVYPWMAQNGVQPIEFLGDTFIISSDMTAGGEEAYNGIGFDIDGKPVITHIAPAYDDETGEITGITREDTPIGGGADMSAYYTSAQTEEAITSKNYVTSAQVETQITSKGYATVSQIPTVPTSNTAFTNDAGYITSAATANMVTSTSVSTIWKGTQAEYDAITTKDPNTFYIIVSN